MAGRETPATRAANAAGLAFSVHEYRHDPAAASYGVEAAEALGVPPARVLKTLVVRLDAGALAVCCVRVDEELDLKAVAAAAGAKRAEMADAAEAERATGYVVGGISPLGQRRRLATLVDADALGHDTVFVSAGRRGATEQLRRSSPAVSAALRRGPRTSRRPESGAAASVARPYRIHTGRRPVRLRNCRKVGAWEARSHRTCARPRLRARGSVRHGSGSRLPGFGARPALSDLVHLRRGPIRAEDRSPDFAAVGRPVSYPGTDDVFAGAGISPRQRLEPDDLRPLEMRSS